NFDHFVDVEIDDQIAVEHFGAMVDLGETKFRAADQHDFAVIEPFAQSLTQTHDIRHEATAQHVHVELHSGLELGELEQRLHQKNGIDAAAAGLEHEADILCGFVANVSEERQVPLQQKLRDDTGEARLSGPGA